MSSHIDWRLDIDARASAAGVILPEATLEEMERLAKSRAFSARLMPCETATSPAIWFQ